MNLRIGPPPHTPPVERRPELGDLPSPDNFSSAGKMEEELAHYRQQIQGVLLKPLDAFTAAWRYARGHSLCDDTETLSDSLIKSRRWYGTVLASALAFQCKGSGTLGVASLGGKSADALKEFMTTIGMLVDTWLEFRKQDEPDIRWSFAYSDLARDMRRAQEARTTWTQPPNWIVKGTMDKPKLILVQRLRGQRTFGQAAKTAAYILWGDFLLGDAKSIDFCEACLHPFRARANKRFHPISCGNGRSANKAHKSKIRQDNWVKLEEVSSELSQRLEKRYRGDVLKGLAHGRWLNRFIRVAEHPSDRQTREELLELCIKYDETEAHIRKVGAVFNHFLKDIAKARAKSR